MGHGESKETEVTGLSNTSVIVEQGVAKIDVLHTVLLLLLVVLALAETCFVGFRQYQRNMKKKYLERLHALKGQVWGPWVHCFLRKIFVVDEYCQAIDFSLIFIFHFLMFVFVSDHTECGVPKMFDNGIHILSRCIRYLFWLRTDQKSDGRVWDCVM